jgi:hypothetical protein
MSKPTLIVGAGLSGLIAANAFTRATIIEQQQEKEPHRALLRFRTSAIGNALDIPFRAVEVRKGIYANGKHAAVNIALANQYSRKVIGRTDARSIWSLDPAVRYIAPENFIEQLMERMRDRITYGATLHSFPSNVNIVNTAPLFVPMRIAGMDADAVEWHYKPIAVHRFRIDATAVHQTIYFPEPATSTYRISITDDLAIAESVPPFASMEESAALLSEAFGIPINAIEPIAARRTQQEFGKIAPIDDRVRRNSIRLLSARYSVYSLGRFATWRNILLDDLLNDITVIKRLMDADDYDAAMYS